MGLLSQVRGLGTSGKNPTTLPDGETTKGLVLLDDCCMGLMQEPVAAVISKMCLGDRCAGVTLK